MDNSIVGTSAVSALNTDTTMATNSFGTDFLNASTITNNIASVYTSPAIGTVGTVFAGNYNTTGTVTMHDPNFKNTGLEVNGNANFAGEVIIKGKNLGDALDRIEERLAILHPNPELEEKWDKLHELRMAYVELEREIIEKEKMWTKLKATKVPAIK